MILTVRLCPNLWVVFLSFLLDDYKLVLTLLPEPHLSLLNLLRFHCVSFPHQMVALVVRFLRHPLSSTMVSLPLIGLFLEFEVGETTVVDHFPMILVLFLERFQMPTFRVFGVRIPLIVLEAFLQCTLCCTLQLFVVLV